MVLEYRASAEEVKAAQQTIRGFERQAAERMAAMTLREIGQARGLTLHLRRPTRMGPARAGTRGRGKAN